MTDTGRADDMDLEGLDGLDDDYEATAPSGPVPDEAFDNPDKPKTSAPAAIKGVVGKVTGNLRESLSMGGGASNKPGTGTESRLSSVLSESTPGPAFTLLRQNGPFVVPGQDAYVILLLPTRGKFGGLSARTRNNEDKGTVINLINADNIHAIVTEDLLTDDVFGLIPDQETLGRMAEVSLMVNAEYRYGVVCEDLTSGGLMVFQVPSVDGKLALSKKLFNQTRAVSNGELPLSDAVDPLVIEALLTLYRNSPDGATGSDRLAAAEQATVNFLVTELSAGKEYPEPAAIVRHLSKEFPELATVANKAGPVTDWASTGKHRASDDDEAAEATGGEQVTESENEPDEAATSPASDDGVISTSDIALSSIDEPEPEPEPAVDPESPEGIAAAEVFGASTDDDGDDDDEAEDDLDFDDGPGTGVIADADEDGVDFGETAPAVSSTELAVISQQLEVLTNELVKRVAPEPVTSASGIPIADDVDRSGAAEVLPGSEFSYSEAVEALGRHYVNDELGLMIDPQPFMEMLVTPVAQLPLPEGSFTPWLGEQAQLKVAEINARLAKQHRDHIDRLYREYMAYADAAAADLVRKHDPRQSPDSEWGKAYQAIEADRARISAAMQDAKAAAAREVREVWSQREEAHVADRAAAARQEFQHRNASRIDAEIASASDKLAGDFEAFIMNSRSELNLARSTSAKMAMDNEISNIISDLRELSEEYMRIEDAAFDEALAEINAYIDAHRRDDMVQADVTARRLQSDTRYEQLVADVQTQIATARQEADSRIAAMKADMAARQAQHEEQLRVREHTAELVRKGNEEREQELVRQRQQQLVDHEAEIAEIQRVATNRIAEADRKAAAAKTELDEVRERNSRMNTAAVILVVLGSIVLVCLGLLAGAFLI